MALALNSVAVDITEQGQITAATEVVTIGMVEATEV